jgi:hypothetical protein
MVWQDGGGTDNNRSAIIETAVRAVIVHIEREEKTCGILEIIYHQTVRLNREVHDALSLR